MSHIMTGLSACRGVLGFRDGLGVFQGLVYLAYLVLVVTKNISLFLHRVAFL
jgi:hypothetical protein